MRDDEPLHRQHLRRHGPGHHHRRGRAGAKRELMGKRISPELEQVMESRKIYQHSTGTAPLPVADGADKLHACVAAPILAEGDLLGLVLFIGSDAAVRPVSRNSSWRRPSQPFWAATWRADPLFAGRLLGVRFFAWDGPPPRMLIGNEAQRRGTIMTIAEQLGTGGSLLWGAPMLGLLLGTGIFLTVRTRFLAWRNLGAALRLLTGPQGPGDEPLRHFPPLGADDRPGLHHRHRKYRGRGHRSHGRRAGGPGLDGDLRAVRPDHQICRVHGWR